MRRSVSWTLRASSVQHEWKDVIYFWGNILQCTEGGTAGPTLCFIAWWSLFHWVCRHAETWRAICSAQGQTSSSPRGEVSYGSCTRNNGNCPYFFVPLSLELFIDENSFVSAAPTIFHTASIFRPEVKSYWRILLSLSSHGWNRSLPEQTAY